MKNLYLLLIIMMLLASSCKNVQKMVDKGEYDKAIVYSAKKLHGEKNKKTKYVTALEEAFEKVTKRDLSKIEYLKDKGHQGEWGDIYTIGKKIEERQSRITPFLPLVSEDGYVAHFKMVNTNKLLLEAASNAAQYHYDKGSEFLELAKSKKDKLISRKAYAEFKAVKKYDRDFVDIEDKIQESLFHGKTRVLLEIRNESYGFLPEDFESLMSEMNIYGLENKWIEYYSDYPENLELDIKADLVFTEMDVSPEREDISRHVDFAEVDAGTRWETEYYYETDTAGVEVQKERQIEVKIIEKVRAEVVEIFRSKEAYVACQIEILDLHNGETIFRKSRNAEALFNDNGLSWSGDYRALCGKHANVVKVVSDFPHDLDMLGTAVEEIKELVKDDLYKMIY